MPTPEETLIRSVEAIEMLPSLLAKGRAECAAEHRMAVYFPVMFVGAHISVTPADTQAVLFDEAWPLPAGAQNMALRFAERRAWKDRVPVGYGWLAVTASGEWRPHMAAFIDTPPRRWPKPANPRPRGRCRSCSETEVIPVYGDGENQGDEVTTRDAQTWTGPWACATCGVSRS